MPIFSQIKVGLYYDSITLMNLQKDLTKYPKITNAAVVMGTPVNKMILRQANLWQDHLETATSDDLIVSIQAEQEAIAIQAWEDGLDSLRKSKANKMIENYHPKTLDTAIKTLPQANIALISVPGRYAAEEARKCLEHGLNVMIFSDNVSIEEEIHLKKMAFEKGLLVMGPDCGTAIISGVGMGFANDVRPGSIGIVGASGTGTQEVCVMVHSYGEGISHAIGTGGRDLSQQVGGITMLQGIQALQNDPKTKVIVIISKPPHPEVMAKVIEATKQSSKPVIINFLGVDNPKSLQISPSPELPITFATTLEETALHSVEYIQNNRKLSLKNLISEKNFMLIQNHQQHKNFQQKYIKALYSGGTLAYETLFLLKQKGFHIYSNISKDSQYRLQDPSKSFQHSIIDLGEDEYTVGRPHPMIDNTFRAQRLIQETSISETSVIVLDLVLGYGSQKDPLATLLPVILQAKQSALEERRHLAFVIYVCGTENDIQNKQNILSELAKHDIILPESNAQTSIILEKLLE